MFFKYCFSTVFVNGNHFQKAINSCVTSDGIWQLIILKFWFQIEQLCWRCNNTVFCALENVNESCTVFILISDIPLWYTKSRNEAQAVTHNLDISVLLHATCFGFWEDIHQVIKNKTKEVLCKYSPWNDTFQIARITTLQKLECVQAATRCLITAYTYI